MHLHGVVFSTARLANMVQRINLQWDAVELETAHKPPSRRVEDYRPHNGVPRCITLDHPWMFERRGDAVRVCNVHTLQSAFVRQDPVGVDVLAMGRRS